MASTNQREGRNRKRLRRRTHKRDRPVAREQLEISTNIVFSRNSIEDEIKRASVPLHLVRIARDHNFIGSETLRVLFLIRRSREDDDVRSECIRNLYTHVAQPADTNHSDFLGWSNSPMTHR